MGLHLSGATSCTRCQQECYTASKMESFARIWLVSCGQELSSRDCSQQLPGISWAPFPSALLASEIRLLLLRWLHHLKRREKSLQKLTRRAYKVHPCKATTLAWSRL